MGHVISMQKHSETIHSLIQGLICIIPGKCIIDFLFCNFLPIKLTSMLHSRPLRRQYTGSVSLKTTDHCIKRSLLPNSMSKVGTTALPELTIFDNKQFLLRLSNVLSSNDCVEIIKHAEEFKFEDVSEKYRFGQQRKSSRLLVLDTSLAENLWGKIHGLLYNEIIDKNVSIRPLGFDVTRGVWDLHGLNEAIRINKYSGKTKGYFGPHKDAQFCPNGDERSIMTLLVYLNEDLKGGETCFYFPKNSLQNAKGLTIKEEINLHDGLENGYKCVKIVPKVGHAVLSSQSILHEALPVSNGTKYILKTDVVVKRSSKEFGFAVEEWEKKDYMNCLDYFRKAQQQELHENFDVASDLYEKALSIRYCYPRCINQVPEADIDTSGYTNCPPEVWLHIFKFLSGYDAQNLVYAYPELDVILAIWEDTRRIAAPKLSDVPYIPKIRFQKGVVTSFVFSDAQFFNENKEECCRVAAMYSFFLLGHLPQDDIYTVKYNPDTQEVCTVALETLLTDVFYGQRCYGSVYNVRQQDPNTRNPKKDFEASVDRNYMLIKHGTEFTGVELPGSFSTESTVYMTLDSSENDDEDCDNDDNDDDDYKSSPVVGTQKGVSHDNMLPIYAEEVPMHHFIQCMLLSANKRNEIACLPENCTTDLFSTDFMSSASKYFEALNESMNGSSIAVVSKLMSPLSFDEEEACICSRTPDKKFLDKLDTNFSTEYFNHLVFDFQQAQLKVEFIDGRFKTKFESLEADLHEKAILHDMDNFGCTGELIQMEVNIEPILSPDASFNHAACQCGHPRFALQQYYNLTRYHHLTSVGMYAKEKDGKMMIWTIYNGIVAL